MKISPITWIGLLLCCSAVLAGCAQRSGCPTDLRGAGEAQARAGAKPELPNASCELSDAERETYFAGRAAGLKWYCDDQRLFDAALAGDTPDLATCPLDYAEAALAAQRTGSEIRAAEAVAQREAAESARLQASDPVAASEAALRARTAQSELEQLRGLASLRGWLVNPALSGQLPSDAVTAPSAPEPVTDAADAPAIQPQ
jgi:hypothetical protein